MHTVYLGLQYSFATLFPFFLDEFGGSRGNTALIQGVQVGVVTSFGIFAGPIVNRFGHFRAALGASLIQVFCGAVSAASPNLITMILIFGVGIGASFSIVYTAVMASTVAWFDKERAFATGVGSSGMGVGQAVYNLLFFHLCTSYGWRVAILVWSATALLLVTPLTFFIRLPRIHAIDVAVVVDNGNDANGKRPVSKSDEEDDRGSGVVDLSFFKDPVFCAWFFTLCLASMGYFSPFTHLVKYAMDVGISASAAPTLMSIIGISNMAGRLLTGKVADHLGHLETFSVSMILSGLLTATLPLLTSFAALVIYSIFFGYFGGAFVGLWSVITADLFGVEHLASAIGVVITSWTLGAFVGAPATGWIYDAVGSYDPAWALCGICMTLSGIWSGLAIPWLCRAYPGRPYRPRSP